MQLLLTPPTFFSVPAPILQCVTLKAGGAGRCRPRNEGAWPVTAFESNPISSVVAVKPVLPPFLKSGANWTGNWGKQGPEFLDHRLALYDQEQRMVFGANTYRAFARMLASSTEDSEVSDPWVTRMRSLPATVVSTTLEGSAQPGLRPELGPDP
jgi:hypothetical protein